LCAFRPSPGWLRGARRALGYYETHEFRTDDVADRAGVGMGAIYRRYRSKDELVSAAVAALVGDIMVPNAGSTEDGRSRFRSTRSRSSTPRA
jgi:AcrR family transcriptional regulator